STGGLPARDFRVARMGAISAHASSVSNKRTDIRFPLAGIVMNGREKTYPGIMNSSTRPSHNISQPVWHWRRAVLPACSTGQPCGRGILRLHERCGLDILPAAQHADHDPRVLYEIEVQTVVLSVFNGDIGHG